MWNTSCGTQTEAEIRMRLSCPFICLPAKLTVTPPAVLGVSRDVCARVLVHGYVRHPGFGLGPSTVSPKTGWP